MKLHTAALPQITTAQTPAYTPKQHAAGIVHLGVGAFHRAHQAWYTDRVLEQLGGDWRIIGVSLRRPDVRDLLAQQDYLYSHVTEDSQNKQARIIAAIEQILVAPEQPQAVIDAIADDKVHVLSLTVTEKAYGLQPQSGELDVEHKDIAADLALDPTSSNPPRSTLGYIAAGLQQRYTSHRQAITVISCDNLSHNGDKLRSALLQFLKRRGQCEHDFLNWIDQHCAFPNTMVDRIVPAVNAAQIEAFSDDYHFEDNSPVFTEPFSQWVIEQRFAGPVPPWDKVGAQYVDDVDAFEALKLRSLNASHSLIAYLGCLYGKATVAEALQEPMIRKAVQALMQESEQTLSMPTDFSVADYQQALIARFDNTALRHRCAQIAMDGSQKIPQRIVPIIESKAAEAQSVQWSCLCIAAWMAFIQQTPAADIDDPLASELKQRCTGDVESCIDALLQFDRVFPPSLADIPELKAGVKSWLDAFNSQQLERAVAQA